MWNKSSFLFAQNILPRFLICWLCMVWSSSANCNLLSIYGIITDTTNPITNNVFFTLSLLFANWSWQCAIKLHFCCTKHTSAVFDGCGWFGCTSANPNTLPRNKITNCTLNTIKIIILQSQIYFLIIPRTVNWSWQFNAVGTVNSMDIAWCVVSSQWQQKLFVQVFGRINWNTTGVGCVINIYYYNRGHPKSGKVAVRKYTGTFVL